MSTLPTGTVTFFFSDIEGSTRLIRDLGDAYPDALLAHHAIQREALALNGGARSAHGKTRLSLQIAADVLDQFPDGVYFVPLAAINDPELVPSAIAQALSVQTSGSRRPVDAWPAWARSIRRRRGCESLGRGSIDEA